MIVCEDDTACLCYFLEAWGIFMAESESLRTISELPEGIMHKILSLLEPKDAVRAGLMSKAWFNVWLTKPNLLFKDADFSSENLAKNMTTLLRYQEQRIGIDRLEIVNDDEFKMFDDAVIDSWKRWIQVAVENGVKSIKYFPFDLELAIFYDWSPVPVVFQAESLVDLQLRGCNLKDIENISCHNLKKLGLDSCMFDELMFEKILSRCKLIDHLYVDSCFGFDRFKLTNLPKLKRLELPFLECDIVEVESSTLEYFYYRGCFNVVVTRLILYACPNLKSLNLLEICIGDEFFSNLACKFPQLEDLVILACDVPRRIRISSPSMKKIYLACNLNYLDDALKLEEAEIDTPSLDSFKFEGTIIPQFNFTAVSSVCVYKIEIGNGHEQMCIKLRTCFDSLLDRSP